MSDSLSLLNCFEHAIRSIACAQVVKARLDSVDDVAVKLFQNNAAVPARTHKQFMSEISIMNACRHNNIVNFIGANLGPEEVGSATTLLP